ncbi:MAG: PilW family protein [Gammaproteobacteria bacterium]|nr:PilW family protein [Gammaproteobacteria bacterium]
MSHPAHPDRPAAPTTQHGFSLIELMVALVIGLILLAGVLQLFLGSKQTYRTQEALGRVQQESRFAFATLSRELRMIGYQGCAGRASLAPNVIADRDGDDIADLPFGNTTPLQGFDGGSGWLNPTPLPRIAGSDVISFRYADGNHARLSGNMASDNANIQLTHNPDQLQAGDLLMIADCLTADIFAASSVSQSGGNSEVTIAHATNRNLDNRLSKAYGPDASVMRVRHHSYFVATENATPGLYRIDGDGNAMRLVEGVEDMRVLYGENTDGGSSRLANTYRRAAAVSDWSRVVALRLALLLRTDSAVAGAPQPYSYRYFSAAAPTDRFLRRELVLSINLRNRMP